MRRGQVAKQCARMGSAATARSNASAAALKSPCRSAFMPSLLAAAACWTVCCMAAACQRAGRTARSIDEPQRRRIVADPEWLAHRYDEQADTFHYRHVTRARHAEVPFATDDYLGKEDKPVVIRREEAAALLDGQAPIHFVFHSAFAPRPCWSGPSTCRAARWAFPSRSS